MAKSFRRPATAVINVERPNKIRALMHSARSEREIVYDGKTVTLYTPAQKYYSTVEFTDTIGKLIERLEERYGVELPLADFSSGYPSCASRQDRIGNECRPGFRRRRSL